MAPASLWQSQSFGPHGDALLRCDTAARVIRVDPVTGLRGMGPPAHDRHGTGIHGRREQPAMPKDPGPMRQANEPSVHFAPGARDQPCDLTRQPSPGL
ncbi:hypothetical protein SKAU_G00009990 [Synaphobranchus kaupii]|uniref:Uncharacterized protein n=1 Tax=Synaphobranchus kaupii TaxID=118154 RepID=A0A9Q1G9U6_SYNKA|nr:hypothetical protein SKAU_G00009990 [Synaphobranchus kaupii]